LRRESLKWLRPEEPVPVEPPLSTGGRSGSASGSMLVSTGQIPSPGARGDGTRCLESGAFERGPRRRKGVQEQPILGGLVFRTRRRAHDLQVIGKVSARVD